MQLPFTGSHPPQRLSRVGKREIGRSYRFICRELDLRLPLTDPANYVSRFGSELRLSGEARTKAIEFIKKAQENKLTSGKSPSGTAAAAIYIASLKSGERRTQREVAEAANVTKVTVRNRFKELSEEVDEEVDDLSGLKDSRKELLEMMRKKAEETTEAEDLEGWTGPTSGCIFSPW